MTRNTTARPTTFAVAMLVLLTTACSAMAAAADTPAPGGGTPPADGPAAGPVKIFVLAGQSNMEGKAKVSLLQTQADAPATRDLFKHLRAPDGRWAERDDVWIKFLDRKGRLTVGYGSPGCIGPELEFGRVVGDRYAEPVLLIKTAWGGRSLFRDFRPPSAGPPPAEVVDKLLADRQKKQPAATREEVEAAFGASYRAMLAEVRDTLKDVGAHFPELAGRGHELAGFVWFQGWNDMIDDRATAAYADNLAHFVRDVRRDLGAPNLPFVVGQMGVGGVDGADAKVRRFKDAQAAGVARPEFAGNAALVKTDAFWDAAADAVYKKGWREHRAEWDTVGSDYPYHYLGSAKTMTAIGRAFGEAVLELRGEGGRGDKPSD